jgi:CheY-like chemotaxis protein
MQRRVLIVDDEPEDCALIQKAVNSAGLDAVALTDSAQASGALNRRIDCVPLHPLDGLPRWRAKSGARG